MFKIKAVNLSSFDTSNVTNMQYMFWYCSSLKYLDLSNFNTSKVTNVASMFYLCSSIVYINLKLFQFQNSTTTTATFATSSSNNKLCCEDTFITNQFTTLAFNCSDDCFKNNIKIDESQNKCVESCEKYEYHNLCIDACPNGILINENLWEDNKCLLNKQHFVECLGNTPEGYYFDSNDQIYKKCFPDCKFCYGPGDKTNNNCIEYKAIKTTNLDISISEEINYSNYV